MRVPLVAAAATAAAVTSLPYVASSPPGRHLINHQFRKRNGAAVLEVHELHLSWVGSQNVRFTQRQPQRTSNVQMWTPNGLLAILAGIVRHATDKTVAEFEYGLINPSI